MTEEDGKTTMGTRRQWTRGAVDTVWAVRAVGGHSPPSRGCVAARSVPRRTLSFRSPPPLPGRRLGAGGLPLPGGPARRGGPYNSGEERRGGVWGRADYRSQEAPRGAGVVH
ncbi:unnamed protein product [Pipistrellus nathusii]|uniref:Uncharacterized protein n=1 Tax=Pipistrellus nathusii TaxID=59473 RepID=A0ABN9ZLK0_PIPNA